MKNKPFYIFAYAYYEYNNCLQPFTVLYSLIDSSLLKIFDSNTPPPFHGLTNTFLIRIISANRSTTIKYPL